MPAPLSFPLEAPLHELCCDSHPAEQEALAFVWESGQVDRWTFGQVAEASRVWADELRNSGVGRGAPVAVILPQGFLAAAVHLGLSRLGAVSVPLSPLFGPEGLSARLGQARPALAIAHSSRADAVREAAPTLPTLSVQGSELTPPTIPAAAAEARALTDAMSLIFTSGTTAQPKGVLLPHRVIAGRMAGFLEAHPEFGQHDDRFWSPADWAWIGGLHDALFAPWAAGVPVFSYERTGGFDPAEASALLQEHGVRNAFLPPTALRIWMRSGMPAPPLRTLHTAGEALPEGVHAWATNAFGCTPREVYGLTECAFVLVNSEAAAGVTGRPPPGVSVGVVRSDGSPSRSGEQGELVVKQGCATMMLGYLEGENVRFPVAKGWFPTGDLAIRDAAGRVTVLGRLDDAVKVSGYRIAPREVEAQLMRHPSVEECAVVGVPDALRGSALKAFVRLAPPAQANSATAEQLRGFVRERLAAHEVPQHVEFVTELPRTPSGKVLRKDLRDANPGTLK